MHTKNVSKMCLLFFKLKLKKYLPKSLFKKLPENLAVTLIFVGIFPLYNESMQCAVPLLEGLEFLVRGNKV